MALFCRVVWNKKYTELENLKNLQQLVHFLDIHLSLESIKLLISISII